MSKRQTRTSFPVGTRSVRNVVTGEVKVMSDKYSEAALIADLNRELKDYKLGNLIPASVAAEIDALEAKVKEQAVSIERLEEELDGVAKEALGLQDAAVERTAEIVRLKKHTETAGKAWNETETDLTDAAAQMACLKAELDTCHRIIKGGVSTG